MKNPFKNNTKSINAIAIIGYGASLLIFILISCWSKDINFWQPDFSYTGFENFYKFYSFPITLVVFTTTLLGVVVAIERFKSSEKQFEKNFQITTQNIHFNNYIKHMELYVIFMVDYFKYAEHNIATKVKYPKPSEYCIQVEPNNHLIENRLSKGYFNDIYLKWFSTELNNHKIKPEIMETISSFTKYHNETYEQILKCIDSKEIYSSHLDKIQNLANKLYLIDMNFYQIHFNNITEYLSRIMIITAIIKKTLDFSGQKLKDIDIIYEILCQPKS